MMKTAALYSGVLLITVAFLIGCSPNSSSAASVNKQAKPAPAQQAKATPKPPAKKKKAPAPKKVFKVVDAWDFTQLEKDAWDWTFPSAGATKSDVGVFYVADGPNGIKLLSQADSLPAFTAVRIEYRIMKKDKDQKEAIRVKAEGTPVLYWADKEHVAKAEEDWPFAIGRHSGFLPQSPKNDMTWIANLAKNKAWPGQVAGLYISLPFPKKSEGLDFPFNVIIKKVELLK